MRDYGRVYSQFWASQDIRDLTDDGRLLALYLMTCVHGHLAGVFFIPFGYVCEDMQWGSERVAKGFSELSAKGFATHCARTNWAWVCKYLAWNYPENPNQVKAARKMASNLPERCAFRAEFMRYLDAFLGPAPVMTRTLPQTLAEPFRTQDQDQDQEQEQEIRKEYEGTCMHVHAHTASGTGAQNGSGRTANGKGPPSETADEPATFAQIRSLYPTRSGSQRWADALRAYRDQIRAGYTEAQMLEGTKRYAAYCTTENIIGQATVQQARTFFGPNRGFLDPWEPGKQVSAAERWMREQEGKDAQH